MIVLSIFVVVTLGLLGFAVYSFETDRRKKAVSPFRVPRAAAVDTWECRKAVHEAGHAACAWCCTLVRGVRVATIEAKGGGGHVLFEYIAYPGSDAEWCRAVIALAGVVAEAAVYGKWDTRGSKEDISDALVHVVAATDQKSDPPWPRLGKDDGHVPALRRMFRNKIAPEVERNLEECWRMARVVVEAHGGKFFKLVTALLTHKTAKDFHMEEVLGARYFEKFIAAGETFERAVRQDGKASIFKPRFFMPLQVNVRRKKAA